MPRLPQFDVADLGLRLFGLSLAGGSVMFAAHMLGQPERKPDIYGMEHLAIYAKPAAPTTQAASGANIDYTPTGATKSAVDSEAPLEILDASPTAATLRTTRGVKRVAPGDRLGRLGRIVSIELQNGKWAVVAQAGVVRAR